MNVARVLLLAIAMVSVNPVFADRARYGDKKDLTAHSPTLTVRHRHDWSLVLEQLRFSLDNPFGVEPNVSSLEFFERDKSIARVPSPALTYLHITPDSRYVVGLSRIKAMNDVQLVVFDRNAKLLLHRHISAEVFAVSAEAYLKLRVTHAKTFAEFDELYRFTQTPYAWREGNTVYLDLWYGTTEPGWSRLIEDVMPGRRASPYSPNFYGSVTNAIYWYHQADPAPRIVERDGRPELIKLRDPEGIEMSIPFRLTPAHQADAAKR
ncbi:hypothetical protein [Steroidobacter agaridevorans]|uniref:hypothetical protein n=1 Tax=Steroidobacter agaridevorans TaxID=2695856 RepID=UPI0013257535|nr:hypothetical protein [Steroidobacter agaridevorans]GFE88516.1 hypothetical protein GCM10011488_34700 [Steroidobacter agaridevorans]